MQFPPRAFPPPAPLHWLCRLLQPGLDAGEPVRGFQLERMQVLPHRGHVLTQAGNLLAESGNIFPVCLNFSADRRQLLRQLLSNGV